MGGRALGSRGGEGLETLLMLGCQTDGPKGSGVLNPGGPRGGRASRSGGGPRDRRRG